MPSPKWCCQIRFTITRAVSGLPCEASHSANPRRRQLDFASAGGSGKRPLGLAHDRQHARRHLRARRVRAAAMQEVRRLRLAARARRSPAPSGTAPALLARAPRSPPSRSRASPSRRRGISATMSFSVTSLRGACRWQIVLSICMTFSLCPSVRLSGGVLHATCMYSGSFAISRSTNLLQVRRFDLALRLRSGRCSASMRCVSRRLALDLVRRHQRMLDRPRREEHRLHPVVVLLRNRIELVVVAARAADRQPHERQRRRADQIVELHPAAFAAA